MRELLKNIHTHNNVLNQNNTMYNIITPCTKHHESTNERKEERGRHAYIP